MHSNRTLKIISYYRVMISKFERYVKFIIGTENEILEIMKCMAMNIHNGNVISIKCFKNYLADERTTKKLDV